MIKVWTSEEKYDTYPNGTYSFEQYPGMLWIKYGNKYTPSHAIYREWHKLVAE